MRQTVNTKRFTSRTSIASDESLQALASRSDFPRRQDQYRKSARRSGATEVQRIHHPHDAPAYRSIQAIAKGLFFSPATVTYNPPIDIMSHFYAGQLAK
ncbi:MAG TPA: hypothetical protein VFF31_12405 [Blastocatellia bacterium]|nr:hypothetical protein [Blastocatellia bacterium]